MSVMIHECRNTYRYLIMELEFDEYHGSHVWVPAAYVTPSGLYDTKENAIRSAMEMLRQRKNNE